MPRCSTPKCSREAAWRPFLVLRGKAEVRFPLPIVVCDEHRVPSLAPELLQPKLVRILDETLRRHGLDLRDMREADVEYEHIQ